MRNSTFLSLRLAACSFYEPELELALLAPAHLRVGQRSAESVSLAETESPLRELVWQHLLPGVSRRGMSDGASLTGSVVVFGNVLPGLISTLPSFLPASESTNTSVHFLMMLKLIDPFPPNAMTSVNFLPRRDDGRLSLTWQGSV